MQLSTVSLQIIVNNLMLFCATFMYRKHQFNIRAAGEEWRAVFSPQTRPFFARLRYATAREGCLCWWRCCGRWLQAACRQGGLSAALTFARLEEAETLDENIVAHEQNLLGDLLEHREKAASAIIPLVRPHPHSLLANCKLNRLETAA